MDPNTLLVLALAAIPNPPPETWEAVAKRLGADDRAALRSLRDELLPGGISHGSAVRLNLLTGATTTLSGDTGWRVHAEGTS